VTGRRSLALAVFAIALLSVGLWLLSDRLIPRLSDPGRGGILLLGIALVGVAAVIGGIKDATDLISSSFHRTDRKRPQLDASLVRLVQFTVDETRCIYRLYRFDPSRDYYKPGPVEWRGGIAHVHGRTFRTRKELDAYQFGLWLESNHYFFRWLDSHGYSEQQVPYVVDYVRPKPTERTSDHPIFYLVVANDSEQQVVVTSIEANVELVIGLRSAGVSRALDPLQAYTMPIKSEVGLYEHLTVPALLIAPGDSAALTVVLVPAENDPNPTGKVLIMSLRIQLAGAMVATSKFMLYFRD
jgi:hypothetical protein